MSDTANCGTRLPAPSLPGRAIASGVVSACLLSCFLALAAAPAASGPTEQLTASIDRIIRVLEGPKLAAPARVAERRAALRKIADDIFDWDEMSRRTLARHWAALTDEQRREFVRLFSELLDRSYMTKIEQYSGEPIRYAGERVEGDLATVKTTIVIKNGTEIPIDYRLLKQGDRWVVFDVNIEGVSLVSNYRTQFNTILQAGTYADLAKKLRTRVEELRAAR